MDPYNRYSYPPNQYPQQTTNQPDQDKKSKKSCFINSAIGAALIGLVGTILTIIFTHQPVPPSPGPGPTQAPTSPAIPQLVSTYQGTINRTTDGAVLSFNLQQISENNNDGSFTGSAVINGCPANVSGQVKADDTLTFKATQTLAGGCNGFEGDYSGVLHADGSMSGQWDVPNTQIGGSWSAIP